MVVANRHYFQFLFLSFVVMFSFKTLELRFRTALYDPTPRPIRILNFTSIQVRNQYFPHDLLIYPWKCIKANASQNYYAGRYNIKAEISGRHGDTKDGEKYTKVSKEGSRKTTEADEAISNSKMAFKTHPEKDGTRLRILKKFRDRYVAKTRNGSNVDSMVSVPFVSPPR